MNSKNGRIILQYFLIWVCAWAFSTYIAQVPFLNILSDHRFIITLRNFCYLGYYLCNREKEEKFTYIKYSIMYFCIFSFLFVFFRPLINISAGGFISLGILIPVLRYSQYLKHKIKYLIQGVSGVISFLILCSGFLYLYPEKPDIEGFINNRETQFTLYSPKNLSKQEAYIKIENTVNKKSQELIFTEGISVYPLKNSTNISYISRFQTGENYIIIQFPNNSLLEIYPQTQLSLQKENQKFSIELERGTIGRNT